MKNQFVSYEIAKALKELGFNEECLGYYYFSVPMELYVASTYKIVSPINLDIIWAPLWQQAILWLNKVGSEKHINIYISSDFTDLTKLELEILKAIEIIKPK